MLYVVRSIELANGLGDAVMRAWQRLTMPPQPRGDSPPDVSVTPTTQSVIDAQHIAAYQPLFHGADKFPTAALERLQTKKVHEKVIGAKFNMNDEVNQVAQQRALTDIGLAQLRWMYSRQYNGEKPNW